MSCHPSFLLLCLLLAYFCCCNCSTLCTYIANLMIVIGIRCIHAGSGGRNYGSGWMHCAWQCNIMLLVYNMKVMQLPWLSFLSLQGSLWSSIDSESLTLSLPWLWVSGQSHSRLNDGSNFVELLLLSKAPKHEVWCHWLLVCLKCHTVVVFL